MNESPRLVMGDRLVIEVSGDKMEEYHVFVHSIKNDYDVIVDMHPTFLPKKTRPVNVCFTLNRYPFRSGINLFYSSLSYRTSNLEPKKINNST